MKYQIPVDGWFSDKVSAASSVELKTSFGIGREVIIRKFLASEPEAAKNAAENISYTHRVRTCLFFNEQGEPMVAADANEFARLTFMYLPAIHIDFSRRAA